MHLNHLFIFPASEGTLKIAKIRRKEIRYRSFFRSAFFLQPGNEVVSFVTSFFVKSSWGKSLLCVLCKLCLKTINIQSCLCNRWSSNVENVFEVKICVHRLFFGRTVHEENVLARRFAGK